MVLNPNSPQNKKGTENCSLFCFKNVAINIFNPQTYPTTHYRSISIISF